MCVMCVVLARAPQAQQRRITELEARLDAAQRGAAQHAALTTAAQRRAGELQEELENNAGAWPPLRVLRRTRNSEPEPTPSRRWPRSGARASCRRSWRTTPVRAPTLGFRDGP